MAESIQDVFWIAPPDLSNMVYVSPGYELVWGRTCQELYRSPQSFLEAIHPEDQQRVRAEVGWKAGTLDYSAARAALEFCDD